MDELLEAIEKAMLHFDRLNELISALDPDSDILSEIQAVKEQHQVIFDVVTSGMVDDA